MNAIDEFEKFYEENKNEAHLLQTMVDPFFCCYGHRGDNKDWSFVICLRIDSARIVDEVITKLNFYRVEGSGGEFEKINDYFENVFLQSSYIAKKLWESKVVEVMLKDFHGEAKKKKYYLEDK